MASKTYIQQTADGTRYRMTRTTKQGRKPLPVELRRPCRVIGSVSAEMRKKLDDEIAYGMFRESDIINMALRLWFDKLDNMQFTVQ